MNSKKQKLIIAYKHQNLQVTGSPGDNGSLCILVWLVDVFRGLGFSNFFTDLVLKLLISGGAAMLA